MPAHPWSLTAAGIPAAAPASQCLASEDECLALINELFPERSAHFQENRDDDCARLFVPSGSLALSTDYFWEDVHFRASYFTPEEAGGKALAVAISDLAAVGASPLGFSMGLMLPPAFPKDALRRLLSGMAAKARSFGSILTGGDLSRAAPFMPAPVQDVSLSTRPGLGLCITVWGEPAAQDAPFLRRGKALPGDIIFSVGDIGLAGAGLHMLEHHGRAAASDWPAACAAHLNPVIHLAEGRALALLALREKASDCRLALMDCSDGPARDVPRLLSGLGADFVFGRACMHPELIEIAPFLKTTPESLLMRGGEDYALLGSCAQEFWPHIQAAVPIARVLGRATPERGMTYAGQALPDYAAQGFDHFSG